ncbi:hypothetical protein MMC22_003680 [Lobaria immixta]|nr:hypothetical protein [Lobaria immixta]
MAQYSLLSRNGYNHSSQTGVDDNSQPEFEKIFRDKPSPSFKSRLSFALLGTLVAAFLVCGIIDALGLTNAEHSKVEEGAPSRIDVVEMSSCQIVPTTTVVFSKEAKLMESPNDESQRSWDALIPIDCGFVNISDAEAYSLMPGISATSGVDRYSVMSEDWTDAARQEERHSQLRDKHAQHCFAYIAESIWCSGDLTIEWAKVEKDGSRRQVDGWGIPHQCKNPKAIRAWMQANHGPVKDDHVHLHN